MRLVRVGMLCTILAGCATVPPLQEDGIAIAEIVQRVKCEIAFALPEPKPPWPTGPFQWMRTWTAKVDLTLATNEQSSITPSAIFTHLFPTVMVPSVGNVGRMFTLGVGAGASTTAVRTEILTFSVSLEEMRKWKHYGNCNLPDGLDLYGNLGLQEWLASALTPVTLGQLRVGRHPAPGGKSVPAPPVFEPESEAADLLGKLRKFTANVKYYAKAAGEALDDARKDGARNEVQATYNDARRIYEAVKAADAELGKAKKEADYLLKNDVEETAAISALFTEATTAGGQAGAAKKSVDAILDGLPHDPPIDALSHSVQFVVALNGNVTPSWTLVNIKGPGATGTFASGSYTKTHTLAIAMGSPSALPNDQSRQLNNLVIIQNLGQSRPGS